MNLLKKAGDANFVIRKWNNFNDQSIANDDKGNKIIYTTKVLNSNLCDYNEVYNLVKGDITVTAAPVIKVSFKNLAPFTKCMTTIGGTTIDDAEDLDLVMPMYDLTNAQYYKI